jgi:predicted RNase H-like nuclease (RuvC/YqgF family)
MAERQRKPRESRSEKIERLKRELAEEEAKFQQISRPDELVEAIWTLLLRATGNTEIGDLTVVQFLDKHITKNAHREIFGLPKKQRARKPKDGE